MATGGYFGLRVLENRYTIRAPSYLELDVRGEDGGVLIEGWRGRISLVMEDGGMELKNIESPEVQVRFQDGKLRMSRIQSRKIDISADDGSVELGLVRSEDLHCRIRTDDGSVRVGLEAGSSVSFAITMDEGSVRVKHPEAAQVSRQRHRVSGRIGGGRGSLEIATTDGTVLLRQSG